MRAASNKCLPGTDLTAHADCFFFFPLLCSNAATHKRVKDIQEQQYTTDVVRHNRGQRNLLRVMKIKRLHVLLCKLFFCSFVSNTVHCIHLKEEGLSVVRY